MIPRILLRSLLTVAALLMMAWSAPAANITHEAWRGDTSNLSRLTLFLSGPIEPGDSKKIADIIEQSGFDAFDDWHDRVIVLDSEGGSLTEAIELMKLFREQNVATYVPANGKCLSACSLAFMAGTDSGAYFRVRNRVLHPTGKLGFHAPSLGLSSDALIPATELNTSYAAALEVVSGIVDMMAEIEIEESLLSTLLSTPPDQFYFVETVDDANRWKISLDIADPANVGKQDIARMCTNFENWLRGDSTLSFGDHLGEVGEQKVADGTVFYVTVNFENDMTCYARRTGLADHSYEILYSSSDRGSAITSLATSNVALDVAFAQHLLAAETRIVDLSSASRRMLLPINSSDPNTEELWCELFENLERVRAADCTKYVRGNTFHYRWPEGDEFTVTGGNEIHVDGELAGVLSYPGGRSCLKIRGNGKVYCNSRDRLDYEQPDLPPLSSLPPSFEGRCSEGKRWAAGIENGDPDRIYAGFYYCSYSDEREGMPPPLQFTCSPGEDAYALSAEVDLPSPGKGQSIHFQVGRTGYSVDVEGIPNEMTGANDLQAELLVGHELIDTLAFENGGYIFANGRQFPFHLKDSSSALRYLQLCKSAQ